MAQKPISCGLTPEHLHRVMRAFSEGLSSTVRREQAQCLPVPTATPHEHGLTSKVSLRPWTVSTRDADGDAMGAACVRSRQDRLWEREETRSHPLSDPRGISGTFAPCLVVGAHEAALAWQKAVRGARWVMRP